MSDSDLYDDDIRLWFEIQRALLRTPHIDEAIEEVERADVGVRTSSGKPPS